MTSRVREDIAKLLAGVNARVGVAAQRVGNIKGANTPPAPDPTFKVRPMGGLIPNGVRAKWEKRW